MGSPSSSAGRRVVRTIIENVAFSLIVKAIVLAFAVAGRASLWAAVGSDLGSMLVVTLNGTKLLSASDEEKTKAKNHGKAMDAPMGIQSEMV